MISINSINRSEALRYLSCQDESIVTSIVKQYIDECEERLLKVISPKYLFKHFQISSQNNAIIIKDCHIELCGNDIAAHLDGCSEIIIMCATIGSAVDKLIRVMQIEDMTKAVITDALANAAIEQVCDIAETEIRGSFTDKYFTWRYSPGYGDFSIDIQKKLLDILDAPRKIGLCTSDSSLLIPIKSVTAFIGISDSPLPSKVRGCTTCNMRDVCQYRKRGSHCGFQ